MNFRWVLHIFLPVLLTINTSCKKEAHVSDTFVYGHAGTSIYPERWVYPANTRESVCYALDVLGAEGVEVDVQMTRDSALVLYHDAYLDENTGLAGCIGQYSRNQLQQLNLYHSPYQLATLDEIMAVCMSRGKKLFLDLKPYHYCDSSNVDLGVFNRALNRVLAPYTSSQRGDVVANTRNTDLLNALTDTSVVLSFETENLNLGKEQVLNGTADEICVQAGSLTSESAADLHHAGIKFSIFGVKTQAEIERGLSLQPLRIITDNIAFTQKKIHGYE